MATDSMVSVASVAHLREADLHVEESYIAYYKILELGFLLNTTIQSKDLHTIDDAVKSEQDQDQRPGHHPPRRFRSLRHLGHSFASLKH